MNALIRGFNCPIVLLLESDLTDVSDFHAQLTDTAGEALQEWDIDSAVIEKNTVILPVKQAESLAYPAGRALVTAEWSVSGKPKGGTQPAPVLIVDYPDKSILGNDETVTEYSATIAASELPDPWEFSTDQLRTAVVVKMEGGGSSYDDTEIRQLIAAEGTARSNADSAEATARAEADSDEAALRAAAVSSEAKARAAADSSLQAYLEAETEARAEAVSTEAAAREAADAGKANAADVYTKTEADALLAKKSNAANVYSKTAADERYVKKTDYASDSSDGILRDTDYMTLESAYNDAQSALNQIKGLAAVATTGSYDDLKNKPTIPTVSNDFTDTYKAEVDALWEDYQTALTLIGGDD